MSCGAPGLLLKLSLPNPVALTICAKFSVAELRLLPCNPSIISPLQDTHFRSARGVLSRGRALVLVLFPRTHGADGE